jgi:hypothetical protein
MIRRARGNLPDGVLRAGGGSAWYAELRRRLDADPQVRRYLTRTRSSSRRSTSIKCAKTWGRSGNGSPLERYSTIRTRISTPKRGDRRSPSGCTGRSMFPRSDKGRRRLR